MDVPPVSFDEFLKLLTAMGAVATFAWGVFQWDRNQKAQARQRNDDARKELEQRRLEAQKPFLDLQLRLYNDVIEVTSVIPIKLMMMGSEGSGKQEAELQEWVARFWELYYGKLAMVENRDVEAAMYSYGKILESMMSAAIIEEAPGPDQPQKPVLTQQERDAIASAQIGRVQQASLSLTKAVRASLDESWGINVWTDKKLTSIS